MGAFSIFTTKKHKSKPPRQTPEVYYETLARRVAFAKYAVLFFLVAFVVFGFTFFGGSLSMDNFRYMLKFMSVDVDTTITDGAYIEFDTEKNTKGIITGGNLAIVDTNGVQIFDMTGERYLKDTEYYSDPMCATNGNMLLVCDRKGNKLNIYSVYAKVYTHTFTHPVLDLCASPNGSYAVLTAARGYRSGIEVYDSNFRIIFYYYFADRYASGIGLSKDGSRAAITTLSNTSDGEFLGGMHVFNTSDAKDFVFFEYKGEIPWKVYFLQNGSYILLTNKRLRIYSPSNELASTVEFGEQSPKGYSFSDDYIALSLSAAGLSNATTIKFYNAAGEYLGEKSYHNNVSALDMAGGYAYIYSVGTLYTIDLKTMETVLKEDIGLAYISALDDKDEKRIIFLYKNKAVFYGSGTYITSKENGGKG